MDSPGKCIIFILWVWISPTTVFWTDSTRLPGGLWNQLSGCYLLFSFLLFFNRTEWKIVCCLQLLFHDIFVVWIYIYRCDIHVFCTESHGKIYFLLRLPQKVWMHCLSLGMLGIQTKKCSCPAQIHLRNVPIVLKPFKVSQTQEVWRFLYSRVGRIRFKKWLRLPNIIGIDGMNSHRNNWLQPNLNRNMGGRSGLASKCKVVPLMSSLVNLLSSWNFCFFLFRAALSCEPCMLTSVFSSTAFCFPGNQELRLFHLNSRERTWLVQLITIIARVRNSY